MSKKTDKEEESYKVVDRRFSASKEKNESPPKSEQGEGFVMKEASESKSEKVPNQVDFSTFVFSLATGALINLGLSPDPATQKVQKNVELAKHNIDILAMIKEKTEGNLSPDEGQLLDNLLTEVRLRFVEASR